MSRKLHLPQRVCVCGGGESKSLEQLLYPQARYGADLDLMQLSQLSSAATLQSAGRTMSEEKK